jgi:hypothetical protein
MTLSPGLFQLINTIVLYNNELGFALSTVNTAVKYTTMKSTTTTKKHEDALKLEKLLAM